MDGTGTLNRVMRAIFGDQVRHSRLLSHIEPFVFAMHLLWPCKASATLHQPWSLPALTEGSDASAQPWLAPFFAFLSGLCTERG